MKDCCLFWALHSKLSGFFYGLTWCSVCDKFPQFKSRFAIVVRLFYLSSLFHQKPTHHIILLASMWSWTTSVTLMQMCRVCWLIIKTKPETHTLIDDNFNCSQIIINVTSRQTESKLTAEMQLTTSVNETPQLPQLIQKFYMNFEYFESDQKNICYHPFF